MPKLTAPRALTAYIARRFTRLATLIAVGIFAATLILCAGLSYVFSAWWWWLLIIPFALLLLVFLLIRIIVLFLIRRIHTQKTTATQKQALEDFTGKLERLIEARGTPPIFLVLFTIKDLVFHRDITTIKGIIRDTTSLKRDYQALEKLF